MNEQRASAGSANTNLAIGPFNKGLGSMACSMTAEQVAAKGWNLLADDLSLPTAVLYDDKLTNNLRWMQQFVEAYGVRLAPHGKTSMAPKLFARQLQMGAWGITMATAQQCHVAQAHGVRRVLMANQLVGLQNMEIIALLLRDREFEYFCLVDSAENVEQLGSFFKAKGLRLQVLLEIGMEEGRAGIRTPEQLQAVCAELSQWKDVIVLCGVEVYEGIVQEEALIREFLQRSVNWTKEIAARGLMARTPFIFSGGGSAWFDIVAEIGSELTREYPAEVVLRPGCYLTHDVGAYQSAQTRMKESNPVSCGIHSSLQPALQIWAYVQSVPETTKAIIGMGKRDAAYDSGLPTPALYVPRGSAVPVAAPGHWKLTRMMDQHAYLQIAAGESIHVGDKVAFDISHPCLAFDKWRYLPIVDGQYTVVDVVETFF